MMTLRHTWSRFFRLPRSTISTSTNENHQYALAVHITSLYEYEHLPDSKEKMTESERVDNTSNSIQNQFTVLALVVTISV